MNRSHRMWGVALVLLAARAAAVAAVSPEATQDLAKKSGLWGQLDSLGAQVRAGMGAALDRLSAKPTEEQKTKMLDCADSAFAADGLRATALDAMAGTLQPADVAPLLAWYGSPLGQKIVAMEESSSKRTPDREERLRRGGEALSSASDARKASLQAILAETHSVDLMADTLIGMALAVQEGVASLDPSASAESMATLRSNLASQRPQVVAHYSEISLPAYAFTYVALPDDELKRYADYLGTPAAMAFNDGTVRGVARALTSASVKLGHCMKDAGAAKAS